MAISLTIDGAQVARQMQYFDSRCNNLLQNCGFF